MWKRPLFQFQFQCHGQFRNMIAQLIFAIERRFWSLCNRILVLHILRPSIRSYLSKEICETGYIRKNTLPTVYSEWQLIFLLRHSQSPTGGMGTCLVSFYSASLHAGHAADRFFFFRSHNHVTYSRIWGILRFTKYT